MEEIKKLLKACTDELGEVLTSHRVVGEPIQAGDATVIPLVSLGVGFGAGGGGGKGKKDADEGEGTGGATAGGGGVKPVAVIVITQDSVRVMPVKGTVSSVADSLAELVTKVVSKKPDPKKGKK